jgi:hypothetical protein
MDEYSDIWIEQCADLRSCEVTTLRAWNRRLSDHTLPDNRYTGNDR